jgi:hypothetical protein
VQIKLVVRHEVQFVGVCSTWNGLCIQPSVWLVTKTKDNFIGTERHKKHGNHVVREKERKKNNDAVPNH